MANPSTRMPHVASLGYQRRAMALHHPQFNWICHAEMSLGEDQCITLPFSGAFPRCRGGKPNWEMVGRQERVWGVY